MIGQQYLLDGELVTVTSLADDGPEVDVVNATGRARWCYWGASSKHRWKAATLENVLAARGISTFRDDGGENDGRRSWQDAAGMPLGRYTAEEGWAFVAAHPVVLP